MTGKEFLAQNLAIALKECADHLDTIADLRAEIARRDKAEAEKKAAEE